MPYGIKTGFAPIQAVESYRSGHDWAAKDAERKRRQPVVEQLEQLKLRQGEQQVKSGEQKMTLNDMAIAEQKRKQSQSEMLDLGNMAKWANTPEKWEQGLDYYAMQGKPVDQFRNRFDLAGTVMGLADPDAARQAQAMEALQAALASGDPAQIRQAQAAIDPEGAVKGALPDWQQVKGKGYEGYVMDANTGEFKLGLKTKDALEKNVRQNLEFKDLRSLNSDVSKITKPANEIRSAATALQGLNEKATPTDQLAAVFKFMKALDPTSVVREGEQQQARQTGGITDQFIGYVDRIRGEGSLPPSVLMNMVNTAKNLTNSAIDSSTSELSGYLNSYGDVLSEDVYGKQTDRIPERFADDAAVIAEMTDLGDGTFKLPDGRVVRKSK
jgi:hypothetical protein